MIRKMAYVGFSYLLGLFFASFFISEASLIVSISAVIISLVILKLKGRSKLVYIVCSVCFAIGTFFYISYDKLCYQKVTAYDGQDVVVSGVLTDYTDYNGDRTAYYIDGRINNGVKAKIYCYGEAKNCDIGNEITVKGTASIPKDSFSFGSLKYYKSKGYFLTVNQPEISISAADKLPVKRAMFHYREYIHDKMRDHLDLESLSLVDAITFGEKSGIADDTKTVLYRAGIGHIMAVSGVHLSIVCSLFWFVLQLTNLNKFTRFGLILFPMLAFVMLSGASNSVIRAAVMLILVYGSELFNRKADLMNSLGIAVILLTVGCPFTVTDASFLLSVTGVIGVGAFAPAIINLLEEKRQLGMISKSLITSAVVSAVVFPICFLYFDEVSVVSPVSNLLLIPACSAILVCAAAVVFTGGAGFILVPLMKICGLCCKFVLGASKVIGGTHFSYIPVSNKFSFLAIIAAVIVSVGTAVYFRKIKLTAIVYTVSCALCILSIYIYRFIPSDHIDVAVLKNGSSSAIVINDGKNASIFDLKKGGLCADNILRYLNRNGIYRIEVLGLLVDSQASVSTYSARCGLYNIGTVICPKSCEEAVYGYIDAEYQFYDDNKNVIVTMPDYTLRIRDNNTLVLNIKGCEILAYDGRNDTPASGSYDVLVEYAGQKPCETVNGNIQIFSDSKAESVTNKDTDSYYGENVLIRIYEDRFETEVLSCAGYY